MRLKDRMAWLQERGLQPELVSLKRHARIRLTDPANPQRQLVITAPISPSCQRGHRNMQSLVNRWLRGDL